MRCQSVAVNYSNSATTLIGKGYNHFDNSLGLSTCTCAHLGSFQVCHTKQCYLEQLGGRVLERIPTSSGQRPKSVLLGYMGRVHVGVAAGVQDSTGSSESVWIQGLKYHINKCQTRRRRNNLRSKKTHVTLMLARLSQEQAGKGTSEWRFNVRRLSDSRRIRKYGWRSDGMVSFAHLAHCRSFFRCWRCRCSSGASPPINT